MQTEQVSSEFVDYVSEYRKCKKSPSYFATNYCKTINIEKNEVALFPEYSYLVRFLDENRIPKNIHIEKSRQMLISWAFMILFLYDLLFVDNVADFITSRKEFLVDDGGRVSTPHSLMGRIRFMHEHLPRFLKQRIDFTYLKATNPATNSFVIGESSNPNAGRSGTWYRALMDEGALIPKSESVFASVYQACKTGTAVNSTPYGRGGCFGRIRFDKNAEFKKYSLHWKLHPGRNQDWYNQQVLNMTPDQVARELDISYEKSIAGQIYSMFDFNTQVGDYKFNPDFPLYRAWDFGIGNPTFVLWIQERPIPGQQFPEIAIIDELEASGQMPPYFAKEVLNKPYTTTNSMGRKVHVDCVDYGDPAGKQRELNLKSWISWLGEFGINIRVKHGLRIADSISGGQRVMPYVKIDRKCTRILECISNYKHPTDDQGHVISDGYEDNWATHGMKAFEYYVANRFGLKKSVIGAL